MNHSTLEIFIQVAETQSVTQAAKRLGRAQSNITTRIQQLEEELAVELFVRGNKKMVLSPAGVQFLSYARRILSLAEEAKRLCIRQPRRLICVWARWRRPPPAGCRRCLPASTAVLTGGYRPRTQPTRQLTGVLTAAHDAALVCLPPGTTMGNLPVPAELAFTRCFMRRP